MAERIINNLIGLTCQIFISKGGLRDFFPCSKFYPGLLVIGKVIEAPPYTMKHLKLAQSF